MPGPSPIRRASIPGLILPGPHNSFSVTASTGNVGSSTLAAGTVTPAPAVNPLFAPGGPLGPGGGPGPGAGIQQTSVITGGQANENNDALLRWSKTVSPRMFGVGPNSIYGGGAGNLPPPPTDAYLFQAGLASLSFTAGSPYSSATFSLPRPFPNGWLTLILTPLVTPPAANTGFMAFQLTAPGFQTVSVYNSQTAGGTFSFCYHAIGW